MASPISHLILFFSPFFLVSFLTFRKGIVKASKRVKSPLELLGWNHPFCDFTSELLVGNFCEVGFEERKELVKVTQRKVNSWKLLYQMSTMSFCFRDCQQERTFQFPHQQFSNQILNCGKLGQNHPLQHSCPQILVNRNVSGDFVVLKLKGKDKLS